MGELEKRIEKLQKKKQERKYTIYIRVYAWKKKVLGEPLPHHHSWMDKNKVVPKGANSK